MKEKGVETNATLCRDSVMWNTVHACSSLLKSRFSESGVLIKKNMQNMQSCGVQKQDLRTTDLYK